MVEAFIQSAPTDVRGEIREPDGQRIDPREQCIRFEPQLSREPPPLSQPDITESILATELHGGFEALRIEIIVG